MLMPLPVNQTSEPSCLLAASPPPWWQVHQFTDQIQRTELYVLGACAHHLHENHTNLVAGPIPGLVPVEAVPGLCFFRGRSISCERWMREPL